MTAMITGEGLLLRAPTHGDRDRWWELFRDPMELRYGIPTVVTLPESPEQLDDRVARAAQALADVEPGSLTVAAQDDPERFLGSVAWMFHAPPPLRIADVGYGVHPDSRGRGVASRALRVLTHWLTQDGSGPRLPRVQLDHSTENIASCRTALSAGYEQEGIRRHFLPLRDDTAPGGERRHDICLHGFVPAS